MRHFTGMFGMRRKISFKIFYNFFMLKSIKNKLKEKSSKKKAKNDDIFALMNSFAENGCPGKKFILPKSWQWKFLKNQGGSKIREFLKKIVVAIIETQTNRRFLVLFPGGWTFQWYFKIFLYHSCVISTFNFLVIVVQAFFRPVPRSGHNIRQILIEFCF